MQTVEQFQTEIQRRDESPARVFNECLGYHFKEFHSSRLPCPLASCRQGPCYQLPNAGCKHEVQMGASVGSEKLRGAGPFPSAGNSHPTTELWWFGTWAAENWPFLSLLFLSCDPAKTGEGFSFQEPLEHTDIAPYQSCFDVRESSVIRNCQWKHFTCGECHPPFSARFLWRSVSLVFSLRHFGELVI